MAIELEEYKGFVCEGCEERSTGDEIESPLYECGNCGTVFTRQSSANDNHQCPDCNRLSSKIAEQGCPQCNEAELNECEGWICPVCDAFIEALTSGEMPDHDCEREEAERQTKLKAKLTEALSKIELVPASGIKVGDMIYIPNSFEETPEEFFNTGSLRLPHEVRKLSDRKFDTSGNLGFILGGLTWWVNPDQNIMKVKVNK